MVNLSYKNDTEEDERLNPGNLQNQEQKAALDNEFNGERMAQDGVPGDLSGGKKESSLAEREENSSPSWATHLTPGGAGSKTKFFTKQRVKKLSPLGVLLILIGVGVGGVATIAPSLLLEQIKNVFSTDLNKSNSALNIRARAILKFKADGAKNGFAETSDGVCGVACKLGTVSDAFVAKMKSVGFDMDVDNSKIPGRNIIKTVTFPADAQGNRVTVKTGDDFIAAMDADPVKAAAFARAMNLSSIFLLSSRFKSLLTSLHLNKAAQTSGDTEEEIEKSENIELGQDTTPAVGDENTVAASSAVGSTRAAPLIDSASVTTIHAKLANKVGIVGALCTGYDIIKGVTLTDKLAKQGAVLAFAWTFLNAADQEEYGDGTPQLATTLGNQLTNTDTNKTTTDSNGNTIKNPYYGESATDSAGYREAAYYDNPGTLSEPQQRFSVTPLGAIAVLSTITTFLVGKPGDVQTTVLSGACSPAAQIGTAVAGCATDAGVASIIPGLGTVAAAAVCAAGQAAAPTVIGGILSPFIGSLIKKIAEYDLPKIASTTIGGEAGDAIFAGSASLFNLTGEAYGMSPATSASQVSDFAVDTSSIQEQEADIARVQARSTPFDIYNQYSFLGSIAQSINFSAFSSSSIGSSLSVIASIIPSSFATLFNPTNAATTPETDAQKEADLYSATCPDSSLAAIGAVCDSFSQPTMVLSSNALGMDTTSNLNYMFSNGYADPTTGAANGDYAQWVTSCAQRTDPLGETSGSISDGNYNWEVGAYCLDTASGLGAPSQNELDNFRVYWMDNQVSDTTDNP